MTTSPQLSDSSLSRRIIPCLDVRAGRTTKGVKFLDNIDIGDPVAMARRYYREGADELIFYDITASSEKRGIMLDVVRRVAAEVFIPFAVGGGLHSLADMRAVLRAGAEKVSVNTGAVLDPEIVRRGAGAFGRQCMVLGMDVLRVEASAKIPSGYEVVIYGGREKTGMDALQWALRAEELGAGEICLNSIDADGTKEGYEINLTRLISQRVGIPVIASGGAGRPEHLRDVLRDGCADAVLVASMIHIDGYSIKDLKAYLAGEGVRVRRAHLHSPES